MRSQGSGVEKRADLSVCTSSDTLEVSATLLTRTLCSTVGWSIMTLVVFLRFSSGSPSKLSLLHERDQSESLHCSEEQRNYHKMKPQKNNWVCSHLSKLL